MTVFDVLKIVHDVPSQKGPTLKKIMKKKIFIFVKWLTEDIIADHTDQHIEDIKDIEDIKRK